MANVTPPLPLPPGSAPDGNRDLIVSGMWVAKPFVAIDAFPDALVLTAKDRKLASRLASPVRLCRRRVGPHEVELLLARGEDRSVGLSLQVPTAANQFKEPYLLMEAEPGNTREVGVREFQFHLQGRLSDDDLAAADWAGYFADAARKLEAFRAKKSGAGAGKKRAKKKVPAKKKGAGARKAKRPTRAARAPARRRRAGSRR